MMTHVKRNAQNLRGFTKPSHIELVVHFRKQTLFPTHTFNCGNHQKENSLYYRKRDRGAELNELIKEMERRYNILGAYF